jgi:plastocyanin
MRLSQRRREARTSVVAFLRLLALAGAVTGLVLGLLLAGEEQGPYVVTAIDYHFHDAHPTFPIGPGRDLMISNASRNRHNVTIPALDYSSDVAPGGRLVIEDVATRFGGPGRYSFVCLFHEDRGMSGTLVLASG